MIDLDEDINIYILDMNEDINMDMVNMDMADLDEDIYPHTPPPLPFMMWTEHCLGWFLWGYFPWCAPPLSRLWAVIRLIGLQAPLHTVAGGEEKVVLTKYIMTPDAGGTF